MSSCMKLHKQPQPFPKAGVKRSPVITQAGSDRRPSPKQEQREVKDFPQVDTYPSNQAYIKVLFQQTLFAPFTPQFHYLILTLFQAFLSATPLFPAPAPAPPSTP